MRHQVLDHGYVEFIESWGRGKAGEPEAGIIEAARQSTQGAFRGWIQDQKLLAFLYNSKPQHSTPFEFAGMTIEVQAPIFVFREWHRHRTQSYNEMSARYSPLPDLCYMPTLERTLSGGQHVTSNKQAQTTGAVLTEDSATEWLAALHSHYEYAEKLYQVALKQGVPKELARCSMPVGHYTRMRATANLRNWLAFMTLRADPHAQWEIQQFAYTVGSIIASEFPQTWALYCNRHEQT